MLFIIDLPQKPSYESVKSLRQAETEVQKNDVNIFYNVLIQSVVGHRVWNKSKSRVLISDKVSVSQEATALWILKNYEGNWKHNTTEGTSVAKFTGSTRGNRMFKGWSSDGIEEYNLIIEHVKNDRINGQDFEETFMQDHALKLERAKAHKLGETVQTNNSQQSMFQTVVCYDDLGESDEHDNEQESPSHDQHSPDTDTPLSEIYPMGQNLYENLNFEPV